MFEEDGSLNVTYSFYKCLNLRPECTDDDITRAYRKLALKYHPDKRTGCPEKFKEIKTAHDILKDPIKREFYDRFGDAGLKFIAPSDGSPMNAASDTSTFVGRTVLRVLSRPTRLIPYFLTIAFINLCLVLFFYFLDKKMYFGGLKTIPWYAIFSLLWMYLLPIYLICGLAAFLVMATVKSAYERLFNSATYESHPVPRRKFLVIAAIVFSVAGAIAVNLCLALFIYSTVMMAIYFDENGKLTDGMTWSSIYGPLILIQNICAILMFIHCLATLSFYQNPKRLWSERLLILGRHAGSAITVIVFNYFIIQFYDSTDGDKSTLFYAFSAIYLLWIYNIISNYFEYKWKDEELSETLLKKFGEGGRVDIEIFLKKELKMRNRIFGIIYAVELIWAVLYNLHYAGMWPKTWSMTNLLLLLCVYAAIIVFGVILPLFVLVMDKAIPPNSFATFDSASPGEEGITVIEIPVRLYRFGFGLAPIQPRIKSK